MLDTSDYLNCMTGGFKGCGHGHPGHPGKYHWSCCGLTNQDLECLKQHPHSITARCKLRCCTGLKSRTPMHEPGDAGEERDGQWGPARGGARPSTSHTQSEHRGREFEREGEGQTGAYYFFVDVDWFISITNKDIIKDFHVRHVVTLMVDIHIRHVVTPMVDIHIRHVATPMANIHIRHVVTLMVDIHIRHVVTLMVDTHIRHVVTLMVNIHISHVVTPMVDIHIRHVATAMVNIYIRHVVTPMVDIHIRHVATPMVDIHIRHVVTPMVDIHIRHVVTPMVDIHIRHVVTPMVDIHIKHVVTPIEYLKVPWGTLCMHKYSSW